MRKKIILLVAMPNSIHTARWVSQLAGQGWEIFIFPSIGGAQTHPQIDPDLVIRSILERIQIKLNGMGLQFTARIAGFIMRRLGASRLRSPAARLRSAILKLRPDLIHSMEMQAAGYLTLEANKLFPGKFPPWLMTLWGSDIFLFGRLQKHRGKIQEVLSKANYFSCECARDSKLARKFGFEGVIFPELPVSGGFDLSALEPIRTKKTSSRQLIMLKGYQGWSGRALVGLHALELCAELLANYTILIFSASSEVQLAAELFSEKTGVITKILTNQTPHHEILKLHGLARIYIGLGISDGISVSMQEAMVMGAFPIQSCTACAEEWVEHGVSGMIVPPEDPNIVEMAIRTALSDDRLVDNAAAINWQVAKDRLDGAAVQKKAVNIYNYVFDQSEKVIG